MKAAIELFIAGMVLAVVLGAIAGWYVMIGIGILHAEVLPAIHPVGYATSWLLTILFGGAADIRSAADRKR